MIRIAAVGMIGLALAAPARAGEVTPHQAVYMLTLDDTQPTSDVQYAAGTLGYRWGEACDGWTIEQRYQLTLRSEGQQPEDIASSFVTWESKDGLRYRFNERKTRNGQVDEEIDGTASLKSPGGPGTAEFSKPSRKSFPLAAGTLFPTAHTLLLIKKGEAGENFVSAEVFDGSTFDGPVLISALISHGFPASDEVAEVKAPFLKRPSWNVRLGFYPDSSKQETPDYELGMRLLDNGISSSMTIDYGDYVIKATLKKIEALAKPAC